MKIVVSVLESQISSGIMYHAARVAIEYVFENGKDVFSKVEGRDEIWLLNCGIFRVLKNRD